MNFVIRGKTREGVPVYYTGQVGEQSQTRKVGKAKVYPRGDGESNARRVADAMNKGTALHGVHWEVAPK